MRMTDIPFGTTDWSSVERTEHKGETGVAYWRTQNFGDIRVRMVEYSPGYRADHWCAKGHILLCLEGELHVELSRVPVTERDTSDRVRCVRDERVTTIVEHAWARSLIARPPEADNDAVLLLNRCMWTGSPEGR